MTDFWLIFQIELHLILLRASYRPLLGGKEVADYVVQDIKVQSSLEYIEMFSPWKNCEWKENPRKNRGFSQVGVDSIRVRRTAGSGDQEITYLRECSLASSGVKEIAGEGGSEATDIMKHLRHLFHSNSSILQVEHPFN